ncbi:uncharacterized protein [Aquarana catesbeiana]|uniref:uncharacterized protein n=1 Tax=Aquarana catesbeiana TaxID=8400 RepID=UPI003CCA5072
MASAVSQVELISAIQAHPELWDVAHPLHGDHIHKVKAWEDISAAITPCWEQMRNAERKEISQIMQRRWKSLRDRVRRDLTDEDKAARSGAPAPTKKQHVYHSNLLFLRQNMQSHTRPTTSNIRLREVELEEAEVQRPSSPMTSTGSPRPISEGGVECTDEESRAVESLSPASQQGGEQRSRGSVRGRGRGRQARGGYNPEADDRVLALLQEVRQERRSMDAFLDTNNPHIEAVSKISSQRVTKTVHISQDQKIFSVIAKNVLLKTITATRTKDW